MRRHHRVGTGILGISFTLMFASCGGGRGADERESLGVPGYSDLTPLLTIGAEGDPHYEFFRIGGACRLGDGTIVVANGGSEELRFFDAVGKYERAAGRKGGGPGEFTNLGDLACRNDTLYAFDLDDATVSVFDRRGEFQRRVSLGRADEGYPFFGGVFADGAYLVTYRHETLPPEKHRILERPIHAYRVSQSGEGQSYPVQTAEWYWLTEMGVAALPFDAQVAFSAGRERFCVLDPHLGELDCFAERGPRTFALHFADLMPSVSSSDVTAWKERRVASVKDPSFRPRIQRFVDEVPFRHRYPLYAQLLLDSNGRAWLGRYALPWDTTAPRTWTVKDTMGATIGETRFPPEFRPLSIRGDTVLGAWRDSLGLQTVRVFAVDLAGP